MEKLDDYRINGRLVDPKRRPFRGVLIPKWQQVERGVITNWDDMEKLWHHSFYHELRVEPKDHPMILTERILIPKANRERITQIMFETLNIPALYMISKEVLSLFAARQTTGCVVQCGDQITTIVPIVEGFPVVHAITKLNFGGGDLDLYLKKVFTERSRGGYPRINNETALKIKETLCYVALDFDEEMKKAASAERSTLIEKSFDLPNGTTIVIGNERFRVPEVLLSPELMGLEEEGIADSTFQSLMKLDPDIRPRLSQSIVLSGGSTLFPGIAERLQKDISTLLVAADHHHGMYVHILAPRERKFSSWIGGSILGSLGEAMQKEWITREEYDEQGPLVVHRKCCY